MSLMVHRKTHAAGSSQRKARKNAGDSMAFGEYLPATTQPRLKTRFQRLSPSTPPTSTEMRLWPQALRGISATLDAGLSLREATAENRTRQPHRIRLGRQPSAAGNSLARKLYLRLYRPRFL